MDCAGHLSIDVRGIQTGVCHLLGWVSERSGSSGRQRRTKASVLSCGCGVRLRPLTRTCPKQLITIANKPDRPYCTEHSRGTGITDIGVILGNVRRSCLALRDVTAFFSPLSSDYWVTRLSCGAFEEERIFAVFKWLQDMVCRRGAPQPILLPPGIDHRTYCPRGRIPHHGKQVLVLARDERWRGLP